MKPIELNCERERYPIWREREREREGGGIKERERHKERDKKYIVIKKLP